MNDYKVCIVAAGIGSRMGPISEHINKAILPVNFKATISYTIEKFPNNIEFVIAVGHKKETIIDYLTIAYPNRKFTFVDVDKYIGPGTGPGYSLLQCKNHLQCPFLFFAADTIALEEMPPPNKNWFGIAPVKKTEDYCTVKIKNNLIYQLDDKLKTDNKFAFMGAAGILDYPEFFDSLEKDRNPINGEIQVSNGFKKLIEKKLEPIGFTWFDTGTLENYTETNRNFSGASKYFDLSKSDEFIYFVNNKVIKFFADEKIIRGRCERAKYLKGLCPEINCQKGNFYSYEKVDGQVLYDILNTQIFNDFLQWMKLNLWKKMKLSDEGMDDFKKACKRFYYDKTTKRLNIFYEKRGIEDTWSNINGVPVPPLNTLFGKIDWEKLAEGIPSNFHGDLQFDNILVTRDPASNLQKFMLIDWRQDFGGLIEYGDLYYDLAKLYGGMTISYKLIKEKKFSFDMSGSSIYYNYLVSNDLIEAREEYEHFLERNGFDINKIKIIRALIFLNMSALLQDPFDLMLYFKGKLLLYKALEERTKYDNVNTTSG